MHADLAGLGRPALVVACRSPRDTDWGLRKAFAASRLERLPHLRLLWFDDSIHDVPVQRPRELAEAILSFTDGLFAAERVPSRERGGRRIARVEPEER